jgi:NADH-quinone oxidoreductase subunit H
LWSVGNVNAGILFIFALTSIGVYGISLAGWASGSKFPLLGSVRSTAQMISYELAMSLSVIGVLILAGSTSLGGDRARAGAACGSSSRRSSASSSTHHGRCRDEPGAVRLGRSRDRARRRLPHRVLGLRFGLFFIAEYLNMITVSCLATLLFLGGWNPLFGPAVMRGSGLCGSSSRRARFCSSISGCARRCRACATIA